MEPSATPPSTVIIERQPDLAKIFGTVAIQQPPRVPPFVHRLLRCGECRILFASGEPHTMQKRQSKAPDRPGSLSLLLNECGVLHLHYQGRAFELGEGEIALLDQASSLTIDHDTSYSLVSVLIPKRLLSLDILEQVESVDRKLSFKDGMGGVFYRMLQDAHARLNAIEHQELLLRSDAEAFGRAICSLSGPLIESFGKRRQVRAAPADWRLQAARRIIEERISDPLFARERVADELGVSVRTLNRLFAAEGTSLSNLILETRLNKARDLLEDANAGFSIKEAAYLAGFSDPAHFSKQFKRRFGLTPTGWAHKSKM